MTFPIAPPVSPMLAKLARELPTSGGKLGDFLFEPKWDGFRAIVFRDGADVEIGSRNEKPLTRYFPDLLAPLREHLPERCVLDGEIVIATDGGLDFDRLSLRIHPAESRVAMLAEETPAAFVAFDLLAEGDEDLRQTPFRERRARLERVLHDAHPPVLLTPATTDRALAEQWFERFEGAGLDGVVAKPLEGCYEEGKRTMLKVKHQRTADCVVGGYRVHKDGGVGSLLLGLFDADGVLHHVGVASSFAAPVRAQLLEELAPHRDGALDDHPWRTWAEADAHGSDGSAASGQRRPGGQSRWTGGKDLSWEPLRIELVAEVAYEHLQGDRFRHTARFQRWRPDREPPSCTYAQLDVPVPMELQEIFGGLMFTEIWTALTGTPEPAARVQITGPPETLPSVFPITQLATVAVVSSLAAAAPDADITVDTRHVAAAFRSERYLRVDGELGGDPFDPLSRFFRAADGWVRLHANYPWHRDALLGVLNVAADRDAVADAVARWPALVLEDAIAGAGGCGNAVRTPAEGRAHPQGKLVAALPLLELDRIGDAPARPSGHAPRVLDLTRVIAGPVCTRTLAAHGADVLRVDSPAMPEPEFLVNDALVGKRSTFLDLRAPAHRDTFESLLADADVVVQGYRPGALDAFGLDAASLVERHPGLVVLTLSAWGHDGPWSGRRGFDSLVQAATGIAVLERMSGEEMPGVLPAQVLDHATGYLAAAAVLTALRAQRRDGGSWHARLSLAQTASWVLRQPRRAVPHVDELDATPALVDLADGDRTVTVVSPPGTIDGRALAWPRPPPRSLGADPPAW